MAITGANLLTGLSDFIGDGFSSTTTGTGASNGSTIVDTALEQYGEDSLRDYYIRITGSGTNQYGIRRISGFAASSGTLTVAPAYAAQVAGSITYELHRYNPSEKFSCLDEARLRAYPKIAKLNFDETLTGDGYSREFAIPSTIRKGPIYAFIEQEMGAHDQWNFVNDPDMDSTSNWTASNLTAATYSRTNSNLLIPKSGDTCTKLTVAASTVGSYTQVVANMANSASASDAAGQRMTLGVWVYARTADRIRIGITDDSGTTYSSYHQGGGWSLLTVADNISTTNSSVLSVLFSVASGTAIVAWADRAWFYYGDAGRITSVYPREANARVRRDDTTQTLLFDLVPPARRQIRLIGRAPLSALGTTAASQVTNTMEVDEPAAQILYAYAAQTLFERNGIYADVPEEVQARLSIVQQKGADFEMKWPFTMPQGSKLQGPFKQ